MRVICPDPYSRPENKVFEVINALSARILGFEIDPVLQSKNVKEHAEVLNSDVVSVTEIIAVS